MKPVQTQRLAFVALATFLLLAPLALPTGIAPSVAVYGCQFTQRPGDDLDASLCVANKAEQKAEDTSYTRGDSSQGYEQDQDGDGYGDTWESQFKNYTANITDKLGDVDQDGLLNIDEFHWLTLPIGPIGPLFTNALDYDQDNWTDGPEVHYWDDPHNNDALGTQLPTGGNAPVVLLDPDYSQSFNPNSNLTTTHNPDADGDGLLDGDEYHTWMSFPEFPDSDCAASATYCKTPAEEDTHLNAASDPNKPGTGDRINDSAELAYWNTISPTAWSRDYDHDGIRSNLLDPDSDADGVLDGLEIPTSQGGQCVAQCTSAASFDTDHDGLLDGHNVLVLPNDARASLFLGANVAHKNNTDGSILFYGEVDQGTDPNNWDSDHDNMPDGWETQYGLNPLVNDSSTDSDSDSLTNLFEYQYDRPTTWHEIFDGAWWYGLEPNNPDTDGDGATDGDEVAHGTDPRDGMSTWNGGVPNDPTGEWGTFQGFNNDNLPEDQMDPTNLYYLKNNIVDKSASTDETTTVIDETTSALISGNVTQALNVVYDATPIAPVVQDATSTVNATQDAVVGLVRCANDAANMTTADPTAITSTVNDTSVCVSQTLLPFVDGVVNRTTSQVRGVTSIAQDLTASTLPAAFDQVATVTPPIVGNAYQALLQDPTHPLNNVLLDVGNLASDPTSASQPLPGSQAAAQVATSQLVPAQSRHPTFTYDTIHALGLDAYWPEIQTANRAANQAGQDPIATVDSTFANLYTERNGVPRITRVVPGQSSCVQLDGSTTTRDANGCDVYATLTISTENANAPNGPTTGARVTPTLTVATAVPGASFNLLALGYVQLANSPTIMVLGYDATNGQPQSWDGTIQDYDATNMTNRSLSIASHTTDPRSSLPLHLVSGAFNVDTSQQNKPVISGEETTLEAESTAAPATLSLGIQRQSNSASPADTSSLKATLSQGSASSWSVNYADEHAGRASNITWTTTGLPAGTSSLTSTAHATTKSAWTWSAPGTTGSLDFGSVEKGANQPARALQLDATSLPASASFTTDATQHQHSYQTGNTALPGPSASSLTFLVAEGATACPTFEGTVATHLLVDAESASLCATARLDNYLALSTTAGATGLVTSGSVVDPTHGSTKIVTHDGNDVLTQLGATPTSWTTHYDTLPNATRELSWQANAIVPSLTLDALFQKDATHQDRAIASFANLPQTFASIIDLAAETMTTSASAPLGATQITLSTTGKAPTAPPAAGGDYVRVNKVQDPNDRTTNGLGYEAAFRLDDGDQATTRVLPDGSITMDATLATTHALTTRYAKDGYAVQLDVTPTSGHVQLALKPGDNAGNATLTYDADTSVSQVHLTARTPQGNLKLDASGVPQHVSIQGDATQQTFGLDASSTLGQVQFQYTGPGAMVPVPTVSSSSYVVLRSLPTAPVQRSVNAQLSSLARFHAAQTSGDVTLDTGAPSSQSLYLDFVNLNDVTSLSLDRTPATVSLTQKPGAFQWTHTGIPATSFDYAVDQPEASRYFQATATSAPSSLTTAWTTQYAGAFDAQFQHNAASIPRFTLNENNGATSSSSASAFHFDAQYAAPSIHATLQLDVGSFMLTSQTSSGTPQPTASVTAAFVANGDQLPAQPASWTGDYAFLSDATSSAMGVLSFTNVNSAQGTFFAGANANAASTLVVDRTAPRGVLVDATSASANNAHATFQLDAAAATFTASLDPGLGTGSEGYRATFSGSAASGALHAFLAKGDRILSLNADALPQTASAQWASGQPLDVTASSIWSPQVDYADAGATVPTTLVPNADHVAIHDSSGSVTSSVLLTRVQNFHLDSALGTLDTRADTSGTRRVLVDYADANARISLDVAALPSGLHAAWNASGRDLQLVASSALGWFHVEIRPTSDEASRLHAELDLVPSGTTTFAQDSTTGMVTFQAAGAVGLVNVGADRGGPNPLNLLATAGLRVGRAVQADEVQLRVPNARSFTTTLAPAARVVLDEVGAAGSTPFTVSIQDPDQSLLATTSSLNTAASRIEWPSTTSPTVGFHAVGLGGADARVSAKNSNGDHAEAHLVGAPSDWTTTFDPTGPLAITGNARASSLDLYAVWLGGAMDLGLTGVPTSFTLAPSLGLRQGTIATQGGSATRATLQLAASSGPNAAGTLPVPTGGVDALTLDTTTSGGLLTLALTGLQSASWDLPNGTGEADPAPVSVHIVQDSSTSASALVQLVHPDHQTRVFLPRGLPSDFLVQLARSSTAWTSDVHASARDAFLQYQDSAGNIFTLNETNAPSDSTMSVTPKAATGTITYTGTGNAASVVMQTRWSGAFAQALLTNGVPTVFTLNSGAPTLQAGSVTTSGTIGHADVFLVPDASNTANRVDPRVENLAVDTNGKAPYESLVASNLQGASWTLPNAGTNAPTVATLARSSPTPGATLLALSGPADDATARIVGAPTTFALSVQPSTNSGSSASSPKAPSTAARASTTSPQPFQVTYTPNGPTTQVDVTNVHSSSGQLGRVSLAGASSATTLTATGASPPTVTIQAPTPPNKAAIQTTDGGTFLNVQSWNPSPTLTASAQRGTCMPSDGPIVTVSSRGTGIAGRTFVQIGDNSQVPPTPAGYFADVRCQPNDISLGLGLPSANDVTFTQSPCNGGAPGNVLGNVEADAPGSSTTPVPFAFATPNVLITGTTRTQATVGFTHLKFGCDNGVTSFEYATTDAAGAPSRLPDATVNLKPTVPPNTPSNPLPCPMNMDGTCILQLSFVGSDLPPTANAIFQGPGDRKGVTLTGGAGGSLGVNILLQPKDKTKTDTHLGVALNMPLTSVVFRKSDQQTLPQPSSNQVIYLDDPSQDTLVLGLDHVASGTFTIDKTLSPFSLSIHTDYSGSSQHGLNIHLTDQDCMQQDIVASNIPSAFSMDMNFGGLTRDGIEVRDSSASISSLRYAHRLSADCDNGSTKGVDLFASAQGIPAGPWNIGARLGAAGYVGILPSGGTIDQIDVGLAAAGNSNRYFSLHMEHARFGYEWDLDGDSNVDHNPYYVYCDGAETRWNFRVRFDNFGVGITPREAGLAVGCDQLQIKWYFEPVLGVPVPHVDRTGSLVWSYKIPAIEVLVAGRWWSTPDELWST